MATISFTIPDDKVDAIVSTLCQAYDYDAMKLVDETQVQFARRMMLYAIKENLQTAQRIVLAAQAAIVAEDIS